MKKIIISIVLILALVATGTVAFADTGNRSGSVHAMDALTDLKLVFESASSEKSTAGSMPWGSSLTYRAEIYWDDGWLEIDSYDVVDWSLTSSNADVSQVWTKEWIGADGVARIKIFAPYGFTGSVALKAVSRIENTLSATQNINVIDGTSITGARFYRSFLGAEIPETEIWDSVKGTYTTVMLPIPDETYYNPYTKPSTFQWRIFTSSVEEGSRSYYYKPNETVSLSIDKYERCEITMSVKVDLPPIEPPTYKKTIGGVYIRSGTKYTDMWWDRVEPAKGYFVYKYSSAKKKYVKVATLKGRDKNGWTDTNVTSGAIYKYKVQPYKIVKSKKKSKKKGMKKSYWVSAITYSDEYSNAWKVNVTPSKTVKKKAGKTVKLTATVSGVPNKKPISSKVRWYSSNKKIATVSKSGVVKLKKKGTCYIRARAHNGATSKKIKVVVR